MDGYHVCSCGFSQCEYTPMIPSVLTVWAPSVKNIILTSFRNNSKNERTRSYYSFIVGENGNHKKNTRHEESGGAVLNDSLFSMVQLDQNSSSSTADWIIVIKCFFPPLIICILRHYLNLETGISRRF